MNKMKKNFMIASILLIGIVMLLFLGPASAQSVNQSSPSAGSLNSIWMVLWDALIFGIGGIFLLVVGFFIWEGLTVKYSIRKEIVENQNQAVAILTASFILGMALIISASIIFMR